MLQICNHTSATFTIEVSFLLLYKFVIIIIIFITTTFKYFLLPIPTIVKFCLIFNKFLSEFITKITQNDNIFILPMRGIKSSLVMFALERNAQKYDGLKLNLNTIKLLEMISEISDKLTQLITLMLEKYS